MVQGMLLDLALELMTASSIATVASSKTNLSSISWIRDTMTIAGELTPDLASPMEWGKLLRKLLDRARGFKSYGPVEFILGHADERRCSTVHVRDQIIDS